MDNFEEIEPQEEYKEEVLWISEDMRSYIYEAARWTRFLAVTGFVFAALTVLSAMGTTAMLSSLAAMSPENPLVKMNPTVLTVIYLIIALLQFYPSLLLFKFSNSAKQAVLFTDHEGLNTAMSNLKSFFKFWGVLIMVFIGLYVLMTIVLVLNGAMGTARTGA